MRMAKEEISLDAIAEVGDDVAIEVQKDIAGGYKLYVHVNGKTMLRIGRLPFKPTYTECK